jgi:hypothetical protein
MTSSRWKQKLSEWKQQGRLGGSSPKAGLSHGLCPHCTAVHASTPAEDTADHHGRAAQPSRASLPDLICLMPAQAHVAGPTNVHGVCVCGPRRIRVNYGVPEHVAIQSNCMQQSQQDAFPVCAAGYPRGPHRMGHQVESAALIEFVCNFRNHCLCGAFMTACSTTTLAICAAALRRRWTPTATSSCRRPGELLVC